MFQPHHYLTRVKDHFKQQPATWQFFAQQNSSDTDWAGFKENLLKNAYRMSPDTEAGIYEQLEQVRQKLQISQTVTLYQLEQEQQPNAFISFRDNEAHLVFCGPILKLLQPAELTALLAHELGHIKLYTIDNGDYHTTSRIVTAIANDSNSEGVFLETGRYYRLYTEIFCDRCALLVTGSEEVAQSSLIKIHTGLQQVSAANYLQQAKEILLTGNTSSTGESHPENFIRVLAVHLYNTTPDVADAETAKLIEQRFDMNALDIFRQHELADHTRHLLAQFTSPQWVQSDTILALCKQYFSDFSATGQQNFEWKAALFNSNVKEYLAYVLLDLALADPTLENVPLGRAFDMADNLDLKTEFAAAVKKEKKLSDKRLRELQADAIKAAAQVNN